jgi:hypothetical protein
MLDRESKPMTGRDWLHLILILAFVAYAAGPVVIYMLR